jgi:RHS repeat-associated protein
MQTNVASSTTYFVGNHYEVTEGSITKYYYAGTQRIALRKNGTLNFLLGDHLGSTSLAANAAGIVINQTQYKAWGEERFSDGTKQTNYGYTGQYSYAKDFGLHFYNARWYDSYLNQFTQPDTDVPASQGVQGLNRYAYVSNNPLRYTDPTGHRNCEEDGYNCPGDKKPYRPTYNNPDYSDWNSRNYGGCFKCHAGVANGQIALTNAQLAEAYSNITTWQAIGYTPIVGTAAVLGAPALGPSIYNAAGVTCLSSPICVTLTGAAGGSATKSSNSSGETADTILGRQVHKNYPDILGEPNYDYNKQIPNTRLRPDAIDWVNRIVRELKPDNPRAIQRGLVQLQGYINALNANEISPDNYWTGILDIYPK